MPKKDKESASIEEQKGTSTQEDGNASKEE